MIDSLTDRREPWRRQRLDENVIAFRDALEAAGYVLDQLPPSSSQPKRPRANSPEAFKAFAVLRGAPQVLTVVSAFAELGGIRECEDFAVSCLPRSRSTPNDQTRTTVISIGGVEVLVVGLDRSTGMLSNVTVWAEADDSMSWTSAWPSVESNPSGLDGGGRRVRLPGDVAFSVLAEPALATMVRRRITAIRGRHKTSRRKDWHNECLWKWADLRFARMSLSFVPAEAWDVSKPDGLQLVAQRASQQGFRRRLLAGGKSECAICGIQLTQVLEAAHLVPHARGGAASSENGRLLCANHHRAFDAGLFKWTGEAFVWVGDGEEPNLGGKRA